MSEKIRTTSLTTGSLLGDVMPSATAAIIVGDTTGCCMITPPTFISSTYSNNTDGIDGVVGPLDCGGGSSMESSVDYAPGAIITQLNFQLIPADVDGSNVGIMESSQISTTSTIDSMQQTSSSSPVAMTTSGLSLKSSGKALTAQNITGKSCRFPRLEECAHFHYERVQLGAFSVRLVDDKSELNSSIASQSIGGDIANSNISNATGVGHNRSFSPSICSFIIKVFPNRCDPFLIKRSFENMKMLDEMLHRCVYDRKISGLKDFHELDFRSEEEVEYAVARYLERFSKIASDSLTCGTILTWLQLDNKGRRLPLADSDTMRSINTPAVGAAYGVRRYQAQASDEISIEVGDMISVIDMPSPAESIWWRGKKSHLQKSHYEVGFFPQSCVATIGDKVPRNIPMPAPLVGQLDVSPTKPVLRKHGKLIAFFRSFILSRPSRRRLKQTGIYRERVFSCDLSEHLLNSLQEIPMVLKCCSEFIENYGIVDGIYRLSGITSNIQRLRRAFDEERIPDLGNPDVKPDIHAVSSLLKMYFRELPNPLCTYQLYDNFVEAIQSKGDSNERLKLMKETVLKLPPPHYRTLKYLSEHLNRVSQHSERTGMTDKNLAIVWAPNLLRSPALESGGVAALRGVGVQAVVTEYLIRNCHHIFDAVEETNARFSYTATSAISPIYEGRLDSLTDCESLLVEQREHDQSAVLHTERPKSLSAGGPKLISLEEAQERHSRVDSFDLKHSMPISMISSNAANTGSYIEVGGGPSSLPDKYHTVLSAPRSWQKRKTHSWKSLFSRNLRSTSGNGSEVKAQSITMVIESDPISLKTATQVKFADTDAIINNSNKTGKSLLKQEKPKSIELFDTSRPYTIDNCKHVEICVRSNSIDSLRTAGHSRSVSHDSYFDLLQSPQRSHMTTCPSRELSELGLNFDREEPEMRIFSESESLVSSPRVGKENVPPTSGATSRRILRARPEEFSSQTNSVNPSPKKQPRLNLLLSPCGGGSGGAGSGGGIAKPSNNWQHTTNPETNTVCKEHAHLSSDESCCKRYKLEDQLSDIQYIDCSTPEHIIANTPQILYANAQVHPPPKSSLTKSQENSRKLLEMPKMEKAAVTQILAPTEKYKDKPQTSGYSLNVNTRYSYPSVQLGGKRKEQENIYNAIKERFSYPGSRGTAKMPIENEISQKQIPESRYNVPRSPPTIDIQQYVPNPSVHLPKAEPDLLRSKNRNSYCEQPDRMSLSFQDHKKEHRSKLSATPCSPIHSPRYSLLLAETSSESSSAVNTPQGELDPLMVTSTLSVLSGISGSSSIQNQHIYGLDNKHFLGTSHESLGSNVTTNSNNNPSAVEKRNMHALKKELSLDLSPINSKMSGFYQSDMLTSLHKQSILISPSNITDNTSQSVTPSEFGYQHLQRPSSMRSLLETDDNSPTYEEYANSPSSQLSSPFPLNSQKMTSPIKSTISITYNLKGRKPDSSKGSSPKSDRSSQDPLLETTFDENIVYEKVKLFRNSVTEVNQLVNDTICPAILEKVKEEDKIYLECQPLLCENEKEVDSLYDVPMCETNNDSLETSDDDKRLYENVELRKPKSIYENVLGEDMRASSKAMTKEKIIDTDDKVEMDSLDSIKGQCNSVKDEDETAIDDLSSKCGSTSRSASNFSVKELATKFEISPIEAPQSGFDFTFRSSLKKQKQPSENKQFQKISFNNHEQNILVEADGSDFKPKLTKSHQITRSLDENAFVREFGSRHLYELTARSTQQLPELSDISNRRKSFDFTRPKTLNPPKRLPGIPIAEEVCLRNEKPTTTMEFHNEKNQNHTSEDDCSPTPLKITPTTENRISLIQNNVTPPAVDLNNSNINLKMLSGVKLDRERIDKIKEERRQQLTQLYSPEAFKSKSKTDLNCKDDVKFQQESLRVKSKSRGDIRVLHKESTMDNFKQLGLSGPVSGSENTLNTTGYNQRVRSISDEKNQNLCDGRNILNVISSNRNENSSKKVQLPDQEFSARATVQKFERKNLEYGNAISIASRERKIDVPAVGNSNLLSTSRNNLSSTREKISPQFSIRDVTAMFESRSQNQ